MSAAPWRVNDGNWNIGLLVKDGYRWPFADRGDSQSFEYTTTERVDKSQLPRRTSMSARATGYGVAYLTEIGDLEDTGDGVWEQQCTYSSVPVKRIEGASINYTLQLWRATIGDAQEHGFFYNVNFELAELTFTYSAEIEYEYFAFNRPLALLKPRVALIFERMWYIGSVPPTQSRVVAEDSEVTLYKGKIYCRRTPYITINQIRPVTKAASGWAV